MLRMNFFQLTTTSSRFNFIEMGDLLITRRHCTMYISHTCLVCNQFFMWNNFNEIIMINSECWILFVLTDWAELSQLNWFVCIRFVDTIRFRFVFIISWFRNLVHTHPWYVQFPYRLKVSALWFIGRRTFDLLVGCHCFWIPEYYSGNVYGV